MTITQDELDAGIDKLLDIAGEIFVYYNTAILTRKEEGGGFGTEVDTAARAAVFEAGKRYKEEQDRMLPLEAGILPNGQLRSFFGQYIWNAPSLSRAIVYTRRDLYFAYVKSNSIGTFWHQLGTSAVGGRADLYYNRDIFGRDRDLVTPLSTQSIGSITQGAKAHIRKEPEYNFIVDAIKAAAPSESPTAPEIISSIGSEVDNVAYYYIIAHTELNNFKPVEKQQANEKYATIYNDLILAGFTPDTGTTAGTTTAKAYVDGVTAECLLPAISATTPKLDIARIAADRVKKFNKKPEAFAYTELLKAKDAPVNNEIPATVQTTVEPRQIQAEINAQEKIIIDADTILQNSGSNVNTPVHKTTKAKKEEAKAKIVALKVQLKGETIVTSATKNKEVASGLDNENGSNNLKSTDVAKASISGKTSTTDGAAPKVEIDSSVFDDSPKVLDLGLKLTFDDPVSRRYFELNTTNPTQLFVEDPIDFRSVQMVKPFFTSGHTSSYFRLMNDPLTAKPAEFINSGKEQPTLKNPFGSGAIYNQFFIKRLDETHSEKFQLTDTISSGQALFSFGEKPEFWTIQGQLINDSLNNWLTKFREAWKHYLRISKLVEHGQFLRIALPAIRLTVDCYPVALSLSHADESESISTFSMQFFVKDWTSWSNINLSINDGTTAYLNSMLSMLSEKTAGERTKGGEAIPDAKAKKGGEIISDLYKHAENLSPVKVPAKTK